MVTIGGYSILAIPTQSAIIRVSGYGKDAIPS